MHLPLNKFRFVLFLVIFDLLTALSVQTLYAGPLQVSPTPNRTLRAIGDIHGDIDALNQILSLSGSLSKNGQIHQNIDLVFVGDMIGVGPNSPAVIQRIMELKNQAPSQNSSVTLIAGNHELNLLSNRFNYISKTDQNHWREWIQSDDDWRETVFEALRINTGRTPEAALLRSFYLSLVPWHQVDGKLFVHSGISDRMMDTELDPYFISEFQQKIQALVESRPSSSSGDWLFGSEGPTLTTRTGDPLLAEFTMERAMNPARLERFMNQHHLDQIIVGHWKTNGEILEHSIYNERILHIDTGINESTGKLSYVDFTSQGTVIKKSWVRDPIAPSSEPSIGRKAKSQCTKALNELHSR